MKEEGGRMNRRQKRGHWPAGHGATSDREIPQGSLVSVFFILQPSSFILTAQRLLTLITHSVDLQSLPT